VVDPTLDFIIDVRVVEDFDADGGARAILGADIEWQLTGLAAVVDELLCVVEIAFAEAAAFENVAPATRANGKIHC
jgi:hypothetical protein